MNVVLDLSAVFDTCLAKMKCFMVKLKLPSAREKIAWEKIDHASKIIQAMRNLFHSFRELHQNQPRGNIANCNNQG